MVFVGGGVANASALLCWAVPARVLKKRRELPGQPPGNLRFVDRTTKPPAWVQAMPNPDQKHPLPKPHGAPTAQSEIASGPKLPPQEVRASAIIVAAGNSTRMAAAGSSRKPWIQLCGHPLIDHTLRAFDLTQGISEVILVAHAADVEAFEQRAQQTACYAKVTAIIAGGEQRADSVRIGLEHCSRAMNVVCIHDAARPLIDPAIIARAIETAASQGSALVAVRVHDTIKRESQQGAAPMAAETLDRDKLWAAQTPQAFELSSFRAIAATAADDGFRPTDDSAIWERYRGPVPIIEGTRDNMKLTTPEQLPLFEALLQRNAEQAT